MYCVRLESFSCDCLIGKPKALQVDIAENVRAISNVFAESFINLLKIEFFFV